MDTYRNPIARDGDFADPFVLRHDGRYYLYCTNPDVRCWSSSDLVAWELDGPTIAQDEFPGLVPFAPEVVYAEGAFYMYTSPSGDGHHVLRAEAPTGPFRAVTGNVGHSIDGNVLVDDDGRWYFYWAGDQGIWGCEMPSPTEFGEPVFTGVHMNGWTEGPFVSKRDGRYVMTLTGNHYLSTGYRINAASSAHPLTGYEDDPLNPVLISTEGSLVGLGHSSSVRGPDLVSTYLVYHNLNPDESRDLDIDRQVWNGRNLQVLGPSTSAPVPAAPDVVSDWGAGTTDGWVVRAGRLEARDDAGHLAGPQAHAVWRTAPVGEVLTAELNLTASGATSTYGVSLGPSAGPSSVLLRVSRDDHAVTAVAGDPGGDTVLATSELPRAFAHDALHCWRVVSDGDTLRLSLDGRLQVSFPFAVAAGSAIGVVASGGTVRIGHCALTAEVDDAADRAAVKPVPGRFWATLAPEAAARAATTTPSDGGYPSVVLGPDLSLTYRLHVQQPGHHTVYLTGELAAGDVLALAVDGRDEHEVRVDRATRVVSAGVDLGAGGHTVTLRAPAGRPVLALVTVASTAEGRHSAPPAGQSLSGYGKRLLDPGCWDDVTLSATVTLRLDSQESHGDLILRATQLSEGGEGEDTRLGINFFLGYSVQLHADRVVLARHDYDERVLATAAMTIEPSLSHLLVVRAVGGRLSVDVAGTQILDVDDPLPHLVGHVGLRTSDAALRVEELSIAPGRLSGPPGG